MRSKLFLFLLLATATAMAQQQDSIPPTTTAPRIATDFQKDLYVQRTTSTAEKKLLWKKALKAPVILTALSLYSFTDNEAFDKHEVKEIRDRVTPSFRHQADNYLQYAPAAAVYGLNLAGIKGKNDFANRTVLLTKSLLIAGAICYPLKKITAVPRPDTGQPNSFPSGHTSTAFAAATFMAKEYGHISPWYSVGAYTVATGVGAMRILNNRHWITDTLAGAAVGILSTNIAYITHRYHWGQHHHKRNASQTMVVPSYDGQTGMVSIVHVMH